MALKCSAFLCDSISDQAAIDAVSFFVFPSTPTRKQTWLDCIGRSDYKPIRSSRVCSKHFDEKHFVKNGHQISLKKDAVPFNQRQNTGVAQASPIMTKRPRRNMVYDDPNEKQAAKESDTTIQRGRYVAVNGDFDNGAIVSSVLQQTNSKKTTLTSKNQNQLQKTSTTAELLASGIRPRRNTAYIGAYNLGKRNRVAAFQNIPSVEQHSIQCERNAAISSATATPRQRNAITNRDNIHSNSAAHVDTPLTDRLSKVPRTILAFVSSNQSKITQHSSIEPEFVARQQHNTALIGQNGFGVGPLTSGNRSSRASKVTKKTALLPIPMNQLSIDTFFVKKTTSLNQKIVVEPRASKKEDCIFGWTLIGSDAIPFIVQDSEEFCSLKMLEKSCLAKYKKRTAKIGPCSANIKLFPVTSVQCDLLNEINSKHCDNVFGKEKFSVKKAKLVRLHDANKYYTFVHLCDSPLMTSVRAESESLGFGFTLVNKASFIPFIILNERKLIPLSYLNCDQQITNMLKRKTQFLFNDDTMYLKFCYKFDGIENVDDCFEVVELMDIKKLAPSNTTFKDCWPTDATINEDLRLTMTAQGIRFESVKRNGLKQ